jgi:hypothetical protein
MSDENTIYQLLGVPPLDLYVEEVYLSLSSRKVLFGCIYDVVEQRRPFQLVFQGCREIKWEVYQDIDSEESCTWLVGILLGMPDYQKPAIITTDHFEIHLLYERWKLETAPLEKS